MENRVYYGEYSLMHWIELILKKNLILPEYQRLFVWDEKKVKTLVETFKKKQFIPPVTIGAYRVGQTTSNYILDGQQRLTSILCAYLGLFPDKEYFKKALENFANEDGENEEEQADNYEFDNIIEWTLRQFVEKGSKKSEILQKIPAGNYKQLNNDLTDDFFNNNYLGFSYLVPSINNEKEQQTFYSSVFRNINIQGETLLPQESRAPLYFLDKDLKAFFDPEFCKELLIKSPSSISKIDFVRYTSLLFQFKKDGGENRLAKGQKQNMEKYYEDFICSVVADDNDSKFARFTSVFPGKSYAERLAKFHTYTQKFGITEFPSIIDMDVYLFGLLYFVVIENKEINLTEVENIKAQLDKQRFLYKEDYNHSKSPGGLGNLRARISFSIETYQEYCYE